MDDCYEKFAYDYDEFGSIENYLENEKAFLEQLFVEHQAQTILDCACGTGQHLLMLSELGFCVFGSDCSASMLHMASENLKKHGKQLPLCQCDFRFLQQAYAEQFDAVLCLTTSLPHLHTDEDLVAALTSMKERLKPNGILVLTQGTTHFTLSLPPIEVVVNREDFSRIFVKEHDDRFQTVHVLDLFHSKERQESNQYDIVYRVLLDEDYRRLLHEAGFETVQIFGDYDRQPYDHNSKRLIVVAK